MKNNLAKKLIKCSGCFMGGLVNAIIILAIFYVLLWIGDNMALSIFIGAFIAYPIASIAKKYYTYYVFKLYKRRFKR